MTPSDVSFRLQPGSIEINSAVFLHLSKEAFLLHIDCKQKYPEALVSVDADNGEIEVLLVPTEDTFLVDRNKSNTLFTIRGFGPIWHVGNETGRYYVRVFGIRRIEENGDWPTFP